MDSYLFNSQPAQRQDDNERGTEFNSCPVMHSTLFGFIILFNWNEGIQRPFQIYQRGFFSKEDIKYYCTEKNLSNSTRIKKLKPLKPLPGQKMSLFGKVEASK